jgi:hypothetical protein
MNVIVNFNHRDPDALAGRLVPEYAGAVSRRKDRKRWRPRRKSSLPRTLGIMLGLGIALGWASVFLIPTAERLGLSHAMANRLPFLGFFLGASWGLGITVSTDARAAFGYLVAPLLLGSVFWFFALLLGGVMVAAGLSPAAADAVAILGFGLGASLGSAPLVAWIVEAVSARRPGSGPRDSEPRDSGPRDSNERDSNERDE